MPIKRRVDAERWGGHLGDTGMVASHLNEMSKQRTHARHLFPKFKPRVSPMTASGSRMADGGGLRSPELPLR